MEDAAVHHARQDDVLVLKFSGSLCLGDAYQASAAAGKFAEQCFKEGGFRHVAIDLTEATTFDSTNLGTLARIARYASEKLGNPPTVFSTNPEITMLLRQAGLEPVLDLVEEAPKEGAALEELPPADALDEGFSSLVLDAHRALAALNGPNKDQFKSVVETFEREQRGELD